MCADFFQIRRDMFDLIEGIAGIDWNRSIWCSFKLLIQNCLLTQKQPRGNILGKHMWCSLAAYNFTKKDSIVGFPCKFWEIFQFSRTPLECRTETKCTYEVRKISCLLNILRSFSLRPVLRKIGGNWRFLLYHIQIVKDPQRNGRTYWFKLLSG